MLLKQSKIRNNMLIYIEMGFYEKMARTLVNIRKIEVILIYAKKNKSPHGLPRQGYG